MYKELLKRNKMIWGINRRIKAFQVEQRYNKIAKHYMSVKGCRSNKELLQEKGWNTIKRENIKIFYLGTDPLQDFGGFLQALNRKFDLKVFYKRDGSYGQYSRGDARDQNLDFMYELFAKYKEEENWVPEILMMQSFGFNINLSKMQRLKELYGFKIINIGMDERLSYKLGIENGWEKGISGLNSIVDLVLVTTPECVDWYLKEGIPALYFPLASNEEVYYPLNNSSKKFDVGFIGRRYGIREELVKYLSEQGINVKAYGPGWESGILDVSQNNEFYNSCKIVLGTGNIGYSNKLMNPKLRDFEVPLTKTLYITNYTIELAELFVEDEEIVLYKSRKELLKKIYYYLTNEVQRESIASKGYKKALENHTYENRLEKVFLDIFPN